MEENNNQKIIVENNEPVTLNVEPPKKKKKGKKVFLFLFLILLIAAGACTWYVINNQDKDKDKKDNKANTEEKDKKKETKKDNKKDDKKEEKKEDDNKSSEIIIYFYNDGNYTRMTDDYDEIEEKKNIISKYMCESTKKCDMVTDQYFTPSMTDTNNYTTGVMLNNKAFIQDGNNKVLFDVEGGKVINKYGSKAFWLKDKYDGVYSASSGRYIEIMDKDDKYYGIIDANGNTIHEFNLEAGPKVNYIPVYQNYYSIESNYIVNYKNGKYGITKITLDEVVVDYKYDDIRLLGGNYYKALEDGKWYLYSFTTKDKVFKDGFDFIFGVYEDVIIADNNKKIYIKDLNGNDLIDTPIENTAKELKEQLEVSIPLQAGVSITKDSYILTISVTKDGKLDATYKYNIATKTLEKE